MASGKAFTEYIIETVESTLYVLDDLETELGRGKNAPADFVTDAVTEFKNWLEGRIQARAEWNAEFADGLFDID
jgi:hypothetical protein